MENKLPLGRLAIESDLLTWAFGNDERMSQIEDALNRHASGDWGELSEQDKAFNDEYLVTGGQIVSEYTIQDKKIWIITSADRSVTTILFPYAY